MTVRKDRRRILGIIAATGGAALVSSLPSLGRRLLLSESLLAVLSDPAGARDIGRAYLQQVPSEANGRQLVSLIAERYPRGMAAQVHVDEVREYLSNLAREDFAHGRTVELNGWVLSRTEARLCALACFG